MKHFLFRVDLGLFLFSHRLYRQPSGFSQQYNIIIHTMSISLYKEAGYGEDPNEERSVGLDRVEKVWADWRRRQKNSTSKSTLLFFNIHLDRLAVDFLLKQRLEDDQSITKIHLVECTYRDNEVIDSLFDFMNQIAGHKLQELMLADSDSDTEFFIRSHFLNHLLGSVHKLPSLRALSVSCVQLDEAATRCLKNLLAMDTCHIRELRLWGCHKSDGALHELVQGIRHHQAGLTFLDLERWQLTDQELVLVSNAVMDSPTKDTLQSLDCSNNPLHSESMSTLTRVLKECIHLRSLIVWSCEHLFAPYEGEDLAERQHFHDAFESFLDELRRNVSLTELNISHCGMNGQVLGPLFRALEANETVQALDVRSTSPISVKTIQDSLPRLRGVADLGIAFYPEEQQALYDVLKKNTSITEVYGTSFDGGFFVSQDKNMHALFRRNKFLKKVPCYVKEIQRDGVTEETKSLWPLCLRQMMGREWTRNQDLSAAFYFLKAVSGDLVAS